MTGKFITTLLIASLGGLIGHKLKVPAGALFGAMVFTAIYNMLTNAGYVPAQTNTILQIIIGATIGLNFNMQMIRELKPILFAAIIMVIGMLIFSLLMGWLITKLTGMDLITALFSTSPGGLSNIVLISEAYGAQVHIVALLHIIRLVSVVVFMPIIVKIISRFIS